MVFEDGLINGDIYIYPRLTSVAMVTKFGTKLAITRPPFVAMATKFKTKWAVPRLVQQISPIFLHLAEVRVEGLAIR